MGTREEVGHRQHQGQAMTGTAKAMEARMKKQRPCIELIWVDEIESQFFFDGAKLICYVSANDAQIRYEYHSKLFEHMGYALIKSKSSRAQQKIIDSIVGVP
jgi:hypothetical protein